MEDQIQNLNAYFTRLTTTRPEDEYDDDEMMIEGDFWEFSDPDQVEAWSLTMVPHTDNMVFNMKYKKSEIFIPLSYEEKVKDVINDVYPHIKVR